MQENVALIKEINDLRREIKSLKTSVRAPPGKSGGKDGQAKEIEMQRDTIRRLRERIEMLEATAVASRPTSRERLPRMEGFADGDPEALAGSRAASRSSATSAT